MSSDDHHEAPAAASGAPAPARIKLKLSDSSKAAIAAKVSSPTAEVSKQQQLPSPSAAEGASAAPDSRDAAAAAADAKTDSAARGKAASSSHAAPAEVPSGGGKKQTKPKPAQSKHAPSEQQQEVAATPPPNAEEQQQRPQPTPPAAGVTVGGKDEAAILAKLRQFIEESGGAWEEGWTVHIRKRLEGRSSGHVDVYYHNPAGKKFRSRTEVARSLGLAVAEPPTAKSAAAKAAAAAALRAEVVEQAKQRAAQIDVQLPLTLSSGVVVHSLGQVVPEEGYYNSTHIWPVGYTACWPAPLAAAAPAAGDAEASTDNNTKQEEEEKGTKARPVVEIHSSISRGDAGPIFRLSVGPAAAAEAAAATSSSSSSSDAVAIVEGDSAGAAWGELLKEQQEAMDAADDKDDTSAAGGLSPQQVLLASLAPLAAVQPLHVLGLDDVAVLQCIEGLPGAEKCTHYQFAEQRGGWEVVGAPLSPSGRMKRKAAAAGAAALAATALDEAPGGKRRRAAAGDADASFRGRKKTGGDASTSGGGGAEGGEEGGVKRKGGREKGEKAKAKDVRLAWQEWVENVTPEGFYSLSVPGEDGVFDERKYKPSEAKHIKQQVALVVERMVDRAAAAAFVEQVHAEERAEAAMVKEIAAAAAAGNKRGRRPKGAAGGDAEDAAAGGGAGPSGLWASDGTNSLDALLAKAQAAGSKEGKALLALALAHKAKLEARQKARADAEAARRLALAHISGPIEDSLLPNAQLQPPPPPQQPSAAAAAAATAATAAEVGSSMSLQPLFASDAAASDALLTCWAFLHRFAAVLQLDAAPSLLELQQMLGSDPDASPEAWDGCGELHMALVGALVGEVWTELADYVQDTSGLTRRELANAGPAITPTTWPEVTRRYMLAAATASYLAQSEPKSTALAAIHLPPPLSNLEPQDWLHYLLGGVNFPDLMSNIALLPQNSSKFAADALIAFDDARALTFAEQLLPKPASSAAAEPGAAASGEGAAAAAGGSKAARQQREAASAVVAQLSSAQLLQLGRLLLLELFEAAEAEVKGDNTLWMEQISFFAPEFATVLRGPRGLDFHAVAARLDAGLYQATGGGGAVEALAADVRSACELWKSALTTAPHKVSAMARFDGAQAATADTMLKALDKALSVELAKAAKELASASDGDACRSPHGKPSTSAANGGKTMSLNAAPGVKEEAGADEEDVHALLNPSRLFTPLSGSCRVCWSDEDHGRLLLCDACDDEYHCYCIEPPLLHIPQGEWYCASCAGRATQQAAAVVSPLPAYKQQPLTHKRQPGAGLVTCLAPADAGPPMALTSASQVGALSTSGAAAAAAAGGGSCVSPPLTFHTPHLQNTLLSSTQPCMIETKQLLLTAHMLGACNYAQLSAHQRLGLLGQLVELLLGTNQFRNYIAETTEQQKEMKKEIFDIKVAASKVAKEAAAAQAAKAKETAAAAATAAAKSAAASQPAEDAAAVPADKAAAGCAAGGGRGKKKGAAAATAAPAAEEAAAAATSSKQQKGTGKSSAAAAVAPGKPSPAPADNGAADAAAAAAKPGKASKGKAAGAGSKDASSSKEAAAGAAGDSSAAAGAGAGAAEAAGAPKPSKLKQVRLAGPSGPSGSSAPALSELDMQRIHKLQTQLESAPLRGPFLGHDRHYNRYWSLMAVAEAGTDATTVPVGILLEQLPPSQHSNVRAATDLSLPPQPGTAWLLYTDCASINALMEYLHPKGLREGVLRTKVAKIRDAVAASTILPPAQPQRHKQPPAAAAEASTAMEVDAVAAPGAEAATTEQQLAVTTTAAAATAAAVQAPAPLQLLKEELWSLYSSLPTEAYRSVWGSPDRQARWVQLVELGTTPTDITAAVVLLEQMLQDACFKGTWRLWGSPAQHPQHVATWHGAWFRLSALQGGIKKNMLQGRSGLHELPSFIASTKSKLRSAGPAAPPPEIKPTGPVDRRARYAARYIDSSTTSLTALAEGGGGGATTEAETDGDVAGGGGGGGGGLRKRPRALSSSEEEEAGGAV